MAIRIKNLILICVQQTSANRGPNLRFVIEAIIKALMSKLKSSRVIKLMD